MLIITFVMTLCVLLWDAVCILPTYNLSHVNNSYLDPSNWNNSRWDVYGNLDPAGTSVQNMNHWGQGVRKDNFCMYDYGDGHDNEKVSFLISFTNV